MTQVKGYLHPNFENGMMSVAWAIQDEAYVTKVDGEEVWHHSGHRKLLDNDRLVVRLETLSLGISEKVLDTKLDLVSSMAALKDAYLWQYVKQNPAGEMQLNFANFWVHSLPRNVDLGLWYRLFIQPFFDSHSANYRYKATLTRDEPPLNKTKENI
jgi:hypothetical protein